jgi:hypothetical protein
MSVLCVLCACACIGSERRKYLYLLTRLPSHLLLSPWYLLTNFGRVFATLTLRRTLLLWDTATIHTPSEHKLLGRRMPGEIQFLHDAAVGGEHVKLIVSGSPPAKKLNRQRGPHREGAEIRERAFRLCVCKCACEGGDGATASMCVSGRKRAEIVRGCVLAVFLEIGVTTAPFLQNIMQTVGQFLGTYNVDSGGQTGAYVYPTIGQDVKPPVWYNTAQMAGTACL